MSKRRKKPLKKPNMSIVMIATVIIVALLIVIAISNAISEGKKVKYEGKLPSDIVVDSGRDANIVINENESEMSRLKEMTERARIEYYVTKFMDYIEEEDYESAYALLNNDYKNNYFSSRTKFEEYVKKNFSKMMDIDYTNFERSGNLYVIWMTVTDAINGGPNSGKEINFVVKENDYNDFELSFSAN